MNASPDKIWPWLMQIGQDRSGFYSYTPLENLFRCAGGSWGFVLEPIDAARTRLLARLREGTPPTLAGRIVGATFWDPADFFMEQRVLKTIKRLAETTA